MDGVRQVKVTLIDTLKDWENRDGVAFLRNVGVKSADKVLDFGCRVGHYSIPAAFAVGETGRVYAVDKLQRPLNELRRKANHLGLENIETIKTSGKLDLTCIDSTVDVILLYDVLHYIGRLERKRLYGACLSILNNNGLFSVYPKHTIQDEAAGEFKDTSVADIIDEIKKSDFHFIKKYCDILSHDDNLNQGCVLNFTQKMRKL
jgi:cyclopropane fatty-acyl-phospholipid synthase-like methyltransferase